MRPQTCFPLLVLSPMASGLFVWRWATLLFAFNWPVPTRHGRVDTLGFTFTPATSYCELVTCSSRSIYANPLNAEFRTFYVRWRRGGGKVLSRVFSNLGVIVGLDDRIGSPPTEALRWGEGWAPEEEGWPHDKWASRWEWEGGEVIWLGWWVGVVGFFMFIWYARWTWVRTTTAVFQHEVEFPKDYLEIPRRNLVGFFSFKATRC